MALSTAVEAKQQGSPPVFLAMTGLALSMLLSSLGTSIANVALPTLAQQFGAPFQQVQWVVLAYLLAVTTVIVSVGRLGDMYGRRRLLLAGLMLFTVASLLCGLAPALPLLIAARALQGLGAAAMMALTMAFVGATVPGNRTGAAMGLLGTMSAVGTALGPTLGGFLIAPFGWQAIFFVNVPLGAAAVWLVMRFLPADTASPSAAPARFDHPGTIMLALSLAAYALAVTLGRGHFGPLNIALLCAAGAAAGLFLHIESTCAAPLLPLILFRNPVLSSGFAMSALVTTVVMATLVVGPFYLAGALRLDAAHVGMVMSAGPLVSALAGVPSGRLADRFGADRMTLAGLLGMAAGCIWLAAFGPSFGVAGYAGGLVLTTAGYALFQAANNTAVMQAIDAASRGVVSGMLNLSRNLGLITGASVMGAVFVLGAGVDHMNAMAPDQLAAGLRATFAVAAVLIAVAIGLCALRPAMERSTC